MKKTLLTLMTMMSSLTFADSCNPCEPCEPCPEFTPCPPPSTCAYNAPHGIDLLCQWDITVSASFLWWEAKEDNLEPGTIENINENSQPNTKEFNQKQMDFQYKPGFKVGLGMNFDCDNWRIYAEYTYLRPSITGSANTLFPLPAELTSSNLSTKWIPPVDQAFSFNQISTDWDLSLDVLDLELSREYYVGRCLTFNTFAGLKAAWIGQQYDVKLGALNDDPQQQASLISKNKTNNWGVGPRMGLGTNWLFCDGFRFFANGSASILYTKYTTNTINASLINSNEVTTQTIDFKGDNICSLKPEADMTLGLGWGDFFCCSKWYFDLEVGYTFMVFWDQNQFQSFNNTYWEAAGGNLVFHGLTVTARLDF